MLTFALEYRVKEIILQDPRAEDHQVLSAADRANASRLFRSDRPELASRRLDASSPFVWATFY